MKHEELACRMRKIMDDQEIHQGAEPEILGDDEWLRSLPAPSVDEFLLEFITDEGRVVFCMRELEWHQSSGIEAQAFRKNMHGGTFFSGEYERREILSRAIIWVAEMPNQRWVPNSNGRILRYLKLDIVERLWGEYYPMVTVNKDEAAALYNAALSFWGSKSQEGTPIPALVLEVDQWCKFGGPNRAEFRQIKMSEYERIQIIMMGRSEALGLCGNPSIQPDTSNRGGKADTYPEGFYPPNVNPNDWT